MESNTSIYSEDLDLDLNNLTDLNLTEIERWHWKSPSMTTSWPGTISDVSSSEPATLSTPQPPSDPWSWSSPCWESSCPSWPWSRSSPTPSSSSSSAGPACSRPPTSSCSPWQFAISAQFSRRPPGKIKFYKYFHSIKRFRNFPRPLRIIFFVDRRPSI